MEAVFTSTTARGTGSPILAPSATRGLVVVFFSAGIFVLRPDGARRAHSEIGQIRLAAADCSNLIRSARKVERACTRAELAVRPEIQKGRVLAVTKRAGLFYGIRDVSGTIGNQCS